MEITATSNVDTAIFLKEFVYIPTDFFLLQKSNRKRDY